MRIKIDGGFIETTLRDDGKIGMSIGCDHFNPDGTRCKTVVNTATITEKDIVKLFSDIFESKENKEVEASET